MFDRAEIARETCYHEAAHAVFVHHHPDLQLRYVEVETVPFPFADELLNYTLEMIHDHTSDY